MRIVTVDLRPTIIGLAVPLSGYLPAQIVATESVAKPDRSCVGTFFLSSRGGTKNGLRAELPPG
jgi:hypothetical protein